MSAPSTALELARAQGSASAELALERADRDVTMWSSRALEELRIYAAAIGREFLIEEARAHLEKSGFPLPPDRRAWGAIAARARGAGFIAPVGLAPALSSRGGYRTLWRFSRGGA